MTPADFQALVLELTELSSETEWVEFKENMAIPDEIGEYVSALANSSALMDRSRGYVLWGIQNVSQEIIGTVFDPRTTKVGNEELEPWLARLLTPTPDIRFHEG